MRVRTYQYAWAVGLTVLATLLRMALTPLVGAAMPFAVYFLVVILTAWYGGFGAAVLGTLLSAAAGTYFFVSPATTSPFLLSTRADRITVFGFIVISVAAAFLLNLQRKTLRRLEREAASRKTAEEAEREQRQWFETTLASIGDAVIATDAELRVIFMNRIAAGLTGWEPGEAKGIPLRQVFPVVNEQTGEEIDNPIDKVIREGVTVELANHTVLIAKDGRRIPLEDSGAPIQRGGSPLGAVLVFRDVTERRKAQQELARSERRYRHLFESNPQPMWVFDRESLAFLAVNQATVVQYGYSREELLQMTLKDIRPAEDIPALLEDVRKPVVELHRDGPWRHRKRDGAIILVEITAHPMQYEGRNACLVLANDITERKKLEDQVQQSQRLESIGRLAGGVAHDFNNLLTVINGYAAQILAELPKGSVVAERVGEISGAGQRAAALTQQLLAFSRRQVVQPRVLNLNHVINDMEQMLRRLIGEDVELIVVRSKDLRNIRADAGQMQQVVMNLAINARDAMPRGGTLILETRDEVLGEEYRSSHPEVRPGRYVVLNVTDNGTGMAPEVQKRIFEPFFTTKPPGSGTGLGLATVHGMVRQSEGWIWVYSEPGAGTTFKIYLPATDETVAAAPAAAQHDLRGTETILLVEDQNDVRQLAVTILERYGYRVLSAATGEEALALAHDFRGTIHLLLTDVVMPGMNGNDLAKQLLPQRMLHVLFMSGYAETAIEHRRILQAGQDYIQKPFTPESLAKKVQTALQRLTDDRTKGEVAGHGSPD
jgi:PAS domain S-box-containing protein